MSAMAESIDTLKTGGKLGISPDAVDLPIVYKAEGYMKTDLKTKKVSLVDRAQVNYGTIELTADSIVLDMETGEVYATGRPDSTGRMAGKPHFRDGSEEFESKELVYNFKSEKGIIKNVMTEQEGGFLQSVTTKKHEDGTLHVNKSKFTTCDAEEPHLLHGPYCGKGLSGREDCRRSGPYGCCRYTPAADTAISDSSPCSSTGRQESLCRGTDREARRGYYLSDGGYYFALNDYL
ncbi:MAG: hypothetical protein MZV63_04200 [Marinilabiliales bacterium]|nr:hypothetical protein [Marinilabiliales bacterium]